MGRIEQLKAFLVTSPADDFVQHALALEYIKSGEEFEARKLFEVILLRNPAYIGSYYHLAKLLERSNARQLALDWYEKGMAAAKKAGDQHAFNELQAAWEDLSG
jgi:Tfp pilus assembly protein PilF